MAKAKDQTEVGITGKPIPKPRTAKQQYELEKKRRMQKHLGTNVGGTQYTSGAKYYVPSTGRTNPRARTFEEFMSICEAVYGGSKGKKEEPKDTRYTVTKADKTANTKAWQNYQSGDKRYKAASHLGEDGEQEGEQLDELRITRLSPDKQEVKRRAQNIKSIRTKKEVLAALQQHAKLQKQGIADEIEYDGESVDEILMITPVQKSTTKKVAKKVTKLEKPDPSDPDYVTKHRAYIKAKQRQEAIDYLGMKSGAEAASERAAAAKKAKLQRQQSDAEAARSAFRTKGVPFSDKKGSGHIVNGKKVYDS